MTDRRVQPRAATRQSSRRRWFLAFAAVVAVVVIGVGAYGIWYLFLQPSGPAAVAANDPAIPSDAGGSLATTDGTWNVDTSIGSFSDFSGSFVGYRVQEKLASIGANTAVGRTPDVSGSLTLQGNTVSAVDISANLQSLRSSDDRRDGQLRRQGIQTDSFPTATFKLTSPIKLDAVPADGASVQATATGDLTLHGVTKQVQVPLTVKRSGSVVAVTGSTDIAFADYQVTPPSSFAVLSIDDHGTLEIQLFFRHS